MKRKNREFEAGRRLASGAPRSWLTSSLTSMRGYVTGRRNNVTVLDVDTIDERLAENAARKHRQPAIAIRTASGKRHLLYRYNGERRQIRPWSQLPIDVLGDNGYALAAPSKLATWLTPMTGPVEEIRVTTPPVPAEFSGMRTGDGRNRALWERCMRAGAGRSLDGRL